MARPTITERLEALEAAAGLRLPETIRARLIAQNGAAAAWWQDEPQEVALYGIDRLEDILPMFQEAWGPASDGLIVVGHVMGGVSRIGVDRQGRVVDLFGQPEMWRPLADSLGEFLDRVDREGVDWIGSGFFYT